jgi:hypothetical protein
MIETSSCHITDSRHWTTSFGHLSPVCVASLVNFTLLSNEEEQRRGRDLSIAPKTFRYNLP